MSDKIPEKYRDPSPNSMMKMTKEERGELALFRYKMYMIDEKQELIDEIREKIEKYKLKNSELQFTKKIAFYSKILTNLLPYGEK